MNGQRMLSNRIPVSTLQKQNPKNDPNNEKVPTIYENTTHFNILFYPRLDFHEIFFEISPRTPFQKQCQFVRGTCHLNPYKRLHYISV